VPTWMSQPALRLGMDFAVPMPPYLVAVSVAGVAAAFDLRRHRIPNWIPLAGFVAGLGLAGWSGGWTGLAASLIGFALGAALILPGYLLGQQGGGDLKLMAALGSLLGAKALLIAFALFLAIVGLWAVIYVAANRVRSPEGWSLGRYGRMLRGLLTTGRLTYIPPPDGDVAGLRVPAGPAIAIAVLLAPMIFP